MKNILKPNPLILANTFSVKKSLLKSRIVMLQKTRSLRLALLKFTFFIPVLLLCFLTALSFKKEIHLENTILVKAKKNLDNIVPFPSLKTKEKSMEVLYQNTLLKKNKTSLEVSEEYYIVYSFLNDENKIVMNPLYMDCVNAISLKLHKKNKSENGIGTEISWEDLNPEFSINNGRLIALEKKGEFMIIPDKLGQCEIKTTEKSLKIESKVISDVLPIAEPNVSLGLDIKHNTVEYLNDDNFPKRLFFTLEAQRSFKFSHPKEAIFIPKKVLVTQYEGENHNEVKTVSFEDGSIDFSAFKIKNGDLFEIRLMTYDYVNSLGEYFTTHLNRREPSNRFVYFLGFVKKLELTEND